MVQDCKFDLIRDVQKVDPTGWIDIPKAYASGSIPPGISADELQYNGIEDPNSIAGMPKDAFEAAQAAKAISGYKAPAKNEE